MTKVDFYILQSNTDEAVWDFSCRLLEKAVRQGHRIFLHTNDSEESKHLDELLWRFKPESYIPHAVADEDYEQDMPIVISHTDKMDGHEDVLVNLSSRIPSDFARFSRFAQVVNQAPERLDSSRRHFAFFKDRGYPIEVNKLNR